MDNYIPEQFRPIFVTHLQPHVLYFGTHNRSTCNGPSYILGRYVLLLAMVCTISCDGQFLLNQDGQLQRLQHMVVVRAAFKLK